MTLVGAGAGAVLAADDPGNGIPAGFPTPTIPSVSFDDIATLLVAAAGLAFVVLTDTVTLLRSFAGQ